MAVDDEAKAGGGDALQLLASGAAHNKISNLRYAGEVSPRAAFDYLKDNQAVLVDVRTIPEWQFVGVPDISDTKSKLINLSWKIYPSFAVNQKFIGDLSADNSLNHETPLFFICRSGGRSLDAAVAATEAGYKYCFNITGGFEGEVDVSGHRATFNGWKYDNLPWIQG